MFGSLWQHFTPDTKSEQEEEALAPDALAILEREASVASDALSTLSARLRQQCEAAEAKPVPSTQFALPHEQLQYLQLLEKRSECPIMPDREAFLEAQRAARDMAALEALRSTQQELFVCAGLAWDGRHGRGAHELRVHLPEHVLDGAALQV
jgi:hypothetical protein